MKEDPFSHVKEALAREALSLVQPGMVIGLGSGSTARTFVRILGEYRDVVHIEAVASSKETYDLARYYGIPLVCAEVFSAVDLVIDGADEVDPQLRLIKGGGGALFREKILIQSAQRSVILVDESKKVDVLGAFSLPIEICPFGCLATELQLKKLGYEGIWRSYNGCPVITDNGNYIYDIKKPCVFPNPEAVLGDLTQIHGIIEVGFVIATLEVWVGYRDGPIVKETRECEGRKYGFGRGTDTGNPAHSTRIS